MKTFYGSFRALEKAFLQHLAADKPGPDNPVLVLCPSGRTAERLRSQLAKQQGLVSNLFFVTFSQLLARLDLENPARPALLPGDNLHDYILKNLLSAAELDRYRLNSSFIRALRASLRDLADSLADGAVLEEYINTLPEPALPEEDRAHFEWLVKVFNAYEKSMEQVPGFRSYKQYFADALAQAEHSAWLAHFREIILYGFYELTGRQLELFNVLRSHYALSVFWLYAQEPAFAYGRKFFETNVLGVSAESEALPLADAGTAAGPAMRYLFTDEGAEQVPPGLHFVCAPHAAGELFFVAKEMLRLHNEQGIAYEDMAVTARSLEPYKTLLPDVWAQNAIPLRADVTGALAARPLGTFLINLLNLARGGFEREDVLSVVTSPYFKHKNNWRYLIEESLAKRDFAQWQYLIRPALRNYDPAFLPWLEQTKQQLEQLEKPQHWLVLTEQARSFLLANTDTELFDGEEKNVWQSVEKILASFARYETIAPRAGAREFLEELLNLLREEQLHQIIQEPGGTAVLDVLNLRGLRFKVLFVLGLNEKSFPQLVREDPILKDYYRSMLRDRLGFWMNLKMERFDEEKMLFFSTAQAADEHLYCSYLRSDEEGKMLIPSSYIVELARAAGMSLGKGPVTYVKTRLAERLRETDFTYLTPKEVSLLLAARSAGDAFYQQAGLLDEATQLSLQAARQIASRGGLTERDGVITSGAQLFEQQNEKGFSPSALQDLANCPMKYFFSKGVGLREKEDVLSRGELAPNLRGDAYHKVLMDYYQKLLDDGLAGQLFESVLQERLDTALAAHYTPQSYKNFGIYPVIWELILSDIHDKLSVFVKKDAEKLGSYIPSLFETSFEGFYAPSEHIKMKLHGILDRIDIDRQHKTFRVLDYKSGRRGSADIAACMFRDVILQPFIYLILAKQMPQLTGLENDGAALLNINKGYGRQELSAAAFESIKERAADFFALLARLIKQGTFVITPGAACEYCPYAAICRRDCFHSLMRARHSSAARQLEEARQ